MIAKGLREETIVRHGVSFCCDENILELDSDDGYTIQHCEYTENHWIAYFYIVNFMLYEFILNYK